MNLGWRLQILVMETERESSLLLPPVTLTTHPIATVARGVSNIASPSLRENKDCFDGQSMCTSVSHLVSCVLETFRIILVAQ